MHSKAGESEWEMYKRSRTLKVVISDVSVSTTTTKKRRRKENVDREKKRILMPVMEREFSLGCHQFANDDTRYYFLVVTD